MEKRGQGNPVFNNSSPDADLNLFSPLLVAAKKVKKK